MKRNVLFVTVMIVILVLAGCQGGDTATEPAPVDTEAAVEALEATAPAVVDGGTLYLCGCEGECDCSPASLEGGTCSCGKELVAHNIIKVDEGIAHLCGCPGGCACGNVDEADGTKCSCGKDLLTVDLAGAGLL